MDDECLVAGVLSGDATSERMLYDRHVDRLFRLAFRMCGQEEEARELTQEAFARVFERLGQFRGEASLSSWIVRVAFTVILRGIEQREPNRSRHISLDSESLPADTPQPPDPWLRARLHDAIDELPPRQRAVFLMHELEGYTHEEIADALAFQPGTSKAHLHHARAALRTKLAPYVENGT